MSTFVTYDARTGEILSVHHGSMDVDHARRFAQQRSKADREHIDAIAVEMNALTRGKCYKVDPQRKTIIESPAGEGMGFAVGSAAELRS